MTKPSEAEVASEMKTPRQTFAKLSDDELRGAEFALRYFRTSPVLRGYALEVLDEVLCDAREEMAERAFQKSVKPKRSKAIAQAVAAKVRRAEENRRRHAALDSQGDTP
jgi:hypothetical protein